MATEMGAISILIPPSESVLEYCRQHHDGEFTPVYADDDAVYEKEFTLDAGEFFTAVSMPGKPHDVAPITKVKGTKIDSSFVGSCTDGRMEDLRIVADIVKGRKVAPGVVFKIVPTTDEIWNRCLDEGLIKIFKEAGVLLGNAGCAGCAAGQIGQNGPGEITVSTGNRNFPGKQGKGDVFLVSPAVAAASAIAGFITTPDDLPEEPAVFKPSHHDEESAKREVEKHGDKPVILEGKVWIIDEDNIDTDMIFHNRHLAITDINEMGQYAFGNLKGWEDYAKKSEPGDIIITGKNFGAGSSRQQAVDCFKALGNQAILAKSFGAIYERNAINAGFPVLTYDDISPLELENRDTIRIDLIKGTVTNLKNGKQVSIKPFSDVQMKIYQKGDLLLA